jgi:hypothetical protein
MHKLFFVAVAMLVPLSSHAAPLPLSIEAHPLQSRVHRNEAFSVDLEMTNTSNHDVELRDGICAYDRGGHTDQTDVVVPEMICSRSIDETIRLKPGEVRHAQIQAATEPDAVLGPRTMRFGFSPLDSADVTWSKPTAIDIVAIGTGVAIVGDRSFEVKNTTATPIAIADHLVVQEQIGGSWTDLTWISAGRCTAATSCSTVPPSASLGTYEWNGMTCAQCACHANTLAERGRYRVVAQSCDGKTDFVGRDVNVAAR